MLIIMSGKKPKVWDHFEKSKDDPKKAVCKLCRQTFAYHSSTSNMSYHLKHGLKVRDRSEVTIFYTERKQQKSRKPANMSHVKKAIKRMKVKNDLARQILGELLGTFVLLLFGCAAAAQVKTSRETKGQFLSVNMAFSVGVMSAMYLSRAVSGAHLNPAVSLSFCVLGDLPWVKLLPYSLAQVLGAYLASGLVYLIYHDAIMEFSGGVLTVIGPNETASIFATYPTDVVSLQTNFLDQVVGTAMLMLCILPLNDKRNAPAPEALLPPIVATVVLGISMSMSANCGAAINPARDLGPRLFTLTAGWGTEVFTCYNYFFWIPIVAPMVGGVVGSIMYLLFIQWHLPEVDEEAESECKENRDQTKVMELNDPQKSSKNELYLKMSNL